MNFDRIDSILEEYLDRGYYPSAVCQIFDREKTLYHKSFGEIGRASCRERVYVLV